MATKKNNQLGRSLIKLNKKGKSQFKGTANQRHTVDFNDGSDWAKLNVRSVTEESTLDEFLTTAQLAGAQFAAERQNIEIISPNSVRKLTDEEISKKLASQEENKSFLCIPRRPLWNVTTTPEELGALENISFLNWRRQLAELEEKENLILTPFERNIEFWKQLWRVVERSDVITQILDARNPLLFLCEDLQKYVKEIDENKENLILINKADYLTETQRSAWAQYFDSINVKTVFFSALIENIDDEEGEDKEESNQLNLEELSLKEAKNSSKLVSKDELIEFFKHVHGERKKVKEGTVTIGLVGYPNVGKSSTINALFKSKKVSVSATPGKTKHFQTLFIDESLMLCDCPGLVFPNFALSKAELIINGIISIDQMTDPFPPVSLVTSNIPRHILEDTYSIILPKPHETEAQDRPVTAEELLNAYGLMRGFMTQRGLPDSSRASRYILKDYVSGKLLYCVAPPLVTQDQYHIFPEKVEKLDEKIKFVTKQERNIMKSTKPSIETFDENFFIKQNIQAHSKGIHGVTGYTRTSDFIRHQSNVANSDDSFITGQGKPWKKHHNRNKREKLRKIYADLDVK